MVGNAELAKEYNYRPQSKLSECQRDVNDQKVERHKRTDFNFSSPTTPLPLFLCARLCLSASRSLLPLDSLLPLQWQADRAAVGAVCPGRAQRGSLVSYCQLYGRLIFTHIMWFGLKKHKQRITLHLLFDMLSMEPWDWVKINQSVLWKIDKYLSPQAIQCMESNIFKSYWNYVRRFCNAIHIPNPYNRHIIYHSILYIQFKYWFPIFQVNFKRCHRFSISLLDRGTFFKGSKLMQ